MAKVSPVATSISSLPEKAWRMPPLGMVCGWPRGRKLAENEPLKTRPKSSRMHDQQRPAHLDGLDQAGADNPGSGDSRATT